MVNFSVDEIRKMMDRQSQIRCLSVIAHVDHGKSTLTDSLIGHAGIIAEAKAGDTRFMDTRKDEQDRTITIKSTGVSLYFQMQNDRLLRYEKQMLRKKEEEAAAKLAADPEAQKKIAEKEAAKAAKKKGKKKGKKGKKAKKEVEEVKEDLGETIDPEATQGYLINLIDSPGHVDFSSEVTAALRVTDGALVVVDCIEGVCVQTETVLRQAIAERIKPILFVNKLDRIFLELHSEPEEAFQTFSRAIESVNVVIATYLDELLGDVQVYPDTGTVGFGSGLHGWGFTVGRFAKMYSKMTGMSKQKLQANFWGDRFYNPKTQKWGTKAVSKTGDENQRGFCEFILRPIADLMDAVMDEKKDVYTPMLEKFNITVPKDARDLVGKPLLKRIMQAWLPAAETLLEMIVNHLPSPTTAQAYRVENLYSGPMDDPCAEAIRKCDPNGPLMMYVSKMVPTSEKGRFYAFGRVFAGTIATGQSVRIQGPDYVPGSKKDLYCKKIQRTVLMMGRYVEQLASCPCGNTIGLVGVDTYILKTGTITNHEEAHNFISMKYSVSPVVRVSVDVKNQSDLPKLQEGLKRLSKSDPLVQCFTAPTGEQIIAGCGELHIEICLKDLREEYMKGAPIKTGEPLVSFKETVDAESTQTCCSKSPNKHNRIYLEAEPLGDELVKVIDNGDIYQDQDSKKRARMLIDEHNWDPTDAKKIWCFGCPPDGIPNLLVDTTKGVQYLNEIKDSMVGAFTQVSLAGIIAEETMMGMRVNIMDVTLHADAIHRGAGQIMPPTKRAIYACQFVSQPRMLEPYYLCDITVPMNAAAGVYATLSNLRGKVVGQFDRVGTPLTQIKAHLPVLESFGFTSLLRQNTGGQAFPQLIFSHYEQLNGNPLEEGSQAYEVVKGVRKRKGLKDELPVFGDYYDRL